MSASSIRYELEQARARVDEATETLRRASGLLDPQLRRAAVITLADLEYASKKLIILLAHVR